MPHGGASFRVERAPRGRGRNLTPTAFEEVMSRSFVLLPALSLLLAAQGAKTSKPHAKAKPAASEPASAPKVLARVGTSAITQEDLQAFLDTLNPQQRMQLQYTPGGMDMVVKRLAERKLLAEKARKQGLERDPKFLRRLAASKDELLAFAYLETQNEALQKQGEVTDAEVKAYYDAHADKFQTPASYDARHILIGKKPSGSEKERTEEELQARIKEVQAALASGKPFEDLVEQYTDDPGSKATKGLYQGVTKGQFVPEFEAASFKQEVGKVGEPVKTTYGYHLIRVEKRTEAALQPFEAVKDQAKQQAQQEKGLKVWNDLIDKLKQEIPVEIVPPAAPKPAPAAQPTAPAKAEGAKK
jgi:peptidyl-prolyl cis-trans isomerase C